MTSAIHTPCERSSPVTPDRARAARFPTLVLLTTILASSLAFIDGSIVNVGLPAIGRALHASGGELAWVVNGYLLPLSALLLVGGAAGDLYGRRRVLLIGTTLFAAASVLCTLAPGLSWLLAGRALQGIGAALLMPNSLAILAATFDGSGRGRAIGIWAAAGAAGGAIGPLLGGWLIDAVGWRTMFLVNLPIALGAIALAVFFIEPDESTEHAPLDVAGAWLAAAALAAITWALTVIAEQTALSFATGTGLGMGLMLAVGFVMVEHRRGDRAMLPLSLFASRRFVGLSVLTLLLYGALGGVFVLVPYALIQARHYSAMAAGAALLPLPLVIALASPIMGRLAAKTGARWPLSIGPLIVAGGFVLAMRITGDGSYWSTTLPAMLVIAIGMAGAVAPLTTAVFASVERAHAGVASGFNSAVARTGGLVATALLGGVFALQGHALAGAFRLAVLCGAVAAFAAGATAFATLAGDKHAGNV